MTKKYQPKYEHDYYKLDVTEIIKKPTKEQLEQSEIVQKYNGFYKMLLETGKRSSEILKSLDNLQDKINGKNI